MYDVGCAMRDVRSVKHPTERADFASGEARLLKIVEGVSGGVAGFEGKVQGLLEKLRSRKIKKLTRCWTDLTIEDVAEEDAWPDNDSKE